MARIRALVTGVHVAAILTVGTAANGQLTDHMWVGGTGSQQWQVNSNWNPAMFPNDPGRMDADPAGIDPVIGANLAVGLPSDLNVNVGATHVTIAALTIGSTSNPIATNITTTGGRLDFENFELNDNSNPDNVICAFNCGAALITSQGAAGVTNTISAVVGLNDVVEITGTRNITLAGGIQEIGTGEDLRALSTNATVFVTGSITTIDEPAVADAEDVPLSLNSGSMSQGTIDVVGTISGAGRMRYGTTVSAPILPFGTVIVRGNNTYSGRTIISRGNLVLAHNNALGTADAKQEGPSAGSLQTGYNILSDDDNRVIANDMIVGQWQTVKGEHSLEWSGIVYQDNARGWINMLPAGKTLKLSGGQFPNHTEEMPPVPGRSLTFDGTGRTLITGGLHNEWSTETQTIDPGNYTGSFRFRGTGSFVVSGGNSTYSGDTSVQGGNVHFATAADLGNTSQVASSAGAVGVDAGVAGILGKLDAADNGGLMLGATEYGMNLDFTGAHSAAAGMSLAAHESGSTYTGAITPAANTYRLGGGSGTLTLPNSNQLTGARSLVVTNGGEVRITGSNNYTGATSVFAKYLTTLQVAGARDTINFDDDDDIPNDQIYVGTTLTVSSLANGGLPSSIGSSSSAATNLTVQGSTLRYVGGEVSTDRLFTIGGGGATIDASGTGAVQFTNSGALGVDIAEQRTGNVNAFVTGNSANDRSIVRNLTSTDDLRPGMPIMSPATPNNAGNQAAGIIAGTVITRIISSTEVGLSIPVGEFAFYNGTPITFGAAPERTLTLRGSNTGNNSLAAVIGNASDGGVVAVEKTGPGKWVLTGANTYTGNTTVEGGTLSISNAFLANSSDVHMTSGGILDLNFTGADAIFELTFDGVSQAIGTWGAVGNAAATFQSPFFTGTGLLQVTSSTVVPVAGDYNNNGVVDAADYAVWRNSVGAGSLPNEGGISPGAVDQADYDFWRSRFGATSGSGSAAGTLGNAVPEPSSVVLVATLLLAAVGLGRGNSFFVVRRNNQ